MKIANPLPMTLQLTLKIRISATFFIHDRTPQWCLLFTTNNGHQNTLTLSILDMTEQHTKSD
ncbi:hypothetical protein JHK82_019075 [Glycine max]|nr:hypothetical protein JHK85_019514 [Glycine max]KAG5143380.1 hypothetical protein JHK82_019075 [Glycine max]